MTDYSYAEAAERLPVSESWLRKNLRKRQLPHHRWGDNEHGTVTFTDEDLAAIRAMFHVAPEPEAAPRRMQGAKRGRVA